MISNEGPSVGPIHRQLAAVLKCLEEADARDGSLEKQLIVTTNFDLMLERAIAAQGIPFSRVIQHKLMKALDVFEYKLEQQGAEIVFSHGNREAARIAKPAEGEGADLSAYAAFDKEIIHRRYAWKDRPTADKMARGGSNAIETLDIQELTGIVIYKCHGSQDIKGSCAISSEDYLGTIGTSSIPSTITTIISNTPLVFLGYSVLDPEFQLIRRNFLKEVTGKIYIAGRRPGDRAGREIEARLWPVLQSRAGGALIDYDPIEFLKEFETTI